jgi:hypothetical protein
MAAARRSTATTPAARRMVTPIFWTGPTPREGVVDGPGQSGGHHLLVPGVALAALGPLEVRGRDPAGVGQDVGDDGDLRLGQDLVAASGVVGPLAASTTTDAFRALATSDVDGPFEGGGDDQLGVDPQSRRPRRWPGPVEPRPPTPVRVT